jgi:threonine/homoserine/homoserine lactone efflux protein
MPPFITGLTIGFTIAMPIGPIGVLCLKRSLRDGRLCGLVTGLGAATADALYGLVAALGLTFVIHPLLAHHQILRGAGGVFLVVLGITMTRTKFPSGDIAIPDAPHLGRAFFSSLVLTLTNPMTILSFSGIFMGFGITGSGGDVRQACWLVSGVFFGSAIWWTILSSGATWLGRRADRRVLRLFQWFAAIVLVGFGAWQLVMLVIDRSSPVLSVIAFTGVAANFPLA